MAVPPRPPCMPAPCSVGGAAQGKDGGRVTARPVLRGHAKAITRGTVRRFDSFPGGQYAPERLYFVTRSDLSEGRRAAQLIHAMDEWAARFGPQKGTVIVYEVPDEAALLAIWEQVDGVLFREPDFDDAATALATPDGPMDLPLLGQGRRRRKRHKTGRKKSYAQSFRPDSPNRLLGEAVEDSCRGLPCSQASLMS